jgi:hypothetical protein
MFTVQYCIVLCPRNFPGNLVWIQGINCGFNMTWVTIERAVFFSVSGHPVSTDTM